MKHKECIEASRNRQLVDDDKFERHIRRSTKRDNASLKAIFDCQTEKRENKLKDSKELWNFIVT